MTNSELYHHGIEGMKWGVRRYQNPDGTLTAAGRFRYGNKTKTYTHKTGFFDKQSEKTLKRLERKAESRRTKGKDTTKIDRRIVGQKAAIDNMKAYKKYTSTGKIVAQNLLLGPIGGQFYRKARARGSGRVVSLYTSLFWMTPVGVIVNSEYDKKAYGVDVN